MRASLVVGTILGSTLMLTPEVSTWSSPVDLAQELRAAKEIYASGKYPLAAVSLSAVVTKLELNSDSEAQESLLLDGYFHLGLTLFALNDSEAAKKSFVEAARLDPDFQVSPEHYAPPIVALFEASRDEALAMHASPPNEGESNQHSNEVERRSVKAVLPWLGAAGAGIGLAAAVSGDPSSVNVDLNQRDLDGDGFTLASGDCDDSDPTVRPNGAVDFVVTFAFFGTVPCIRTNPRQQIYRIENKSCSTFSLSQLERQVKVIDTLGRTTDSQTSLLPMDVREIGPGETATVRTGPPGGTTRALCRDLSLANPFSRPRGDLQVDEVYTVRVGEMALASANSFVVLDTKGCSFCSLNSIFGPYAGRTAAAPTLNWSSELTVPEAEARVVINSADRISLSSGGSTTSSIGKPGENILEGELVVANGKPGNWRFEFDPESIEPGSLRVLEGNLTAALPSGILFRLRGDPGERIVFSVRVRE